MSETTDKVMSEAEWGAAWNQAIESDADAYGCGRVDERDAAQRSLIAHDRALRAEVAKLRGLLGRALMAAAHMKLKGSSERVVEYGRKLQDDIRATLPPKPEDPRPVYCEDCGQWFDAMAAECIDNPLLDHHTLSDHAVIICPHCGSTGDEKLRVTRTDP